MPRYNRQKYNVRIVVTATVEKVYIVPKSQEDDDYVSIANDELTGLISSKDWSINDIDEDARDIVDAEPPDDH